MLQLRVNKRKGSGHGVDAASPAVSKLCQVLQAAIACRWGALSVPKRVEAWPLSAVCGRSTSRKRMNWNDGELAGGVDVSLVLRPYRERKRTIVAAGSQSEEASR